MPQTTRQKIEDIINAVTAEHKEWTGDQLSNHAMKLAGYLYPLRMYEGETERQCNLRIMTLMTDKDFWTKSELRRSVSAARTQMMTEDVYEDYWKVKALRESAEETIRTIKARIKVMLAEQHEFS